MFGDKTEPEGEEEEKFLERGFRRPATLGEGRRGSGTADPA